MKFFKNLFNWKSTHSIVTYVSDSREVVNSMMEYNVLSQFKDATAKIVERRGSVRLYHVMDNEPKSINDFVKELVSCSGIEYESMRVEPIDRNLIFISHYTMCGLMVDAVIGKDVVDYATTIKPAEIKE